MKRFMISIVCLAILLVVPAFAADVVYYKDSDGNGWFTNGGIWKEVKTNKVYKFLNETKDTIYVGQVDDGIMETNQ